ncbi:hypothetical protein LCGC14_1256290 [marine sediment metagenome]|uniref:DUF4864 domain-containing protein n=2 Tax=root TaxID=1 RepID=A0A831W0Q4_9GAMM|nr:DUF4864 domain-containing protein [Marinobacter antarcticus]HEA53625.1 DUF4864 domain-containing protein [Marinobacter antarcticus]
MGQQSISTGKSVTLFLIITQMAILMVILSVAIVWPPRALASDDDKRVDNKVAEAREAVGNHDIIDIQDTILRQIEAFANNDREQAWAYASGGIKRRFGSSQVFVDMVREAYPAVHDATEIEFTENVHQGIFYMQGVKFKGPEGKLWDAYYQMIQVEGAWKIAGVRLQPAETGI